MSKLTDIISQHMTFEDATVADIITFCEAPWGLNMNKGLGIAPKKREGVTVLRPVQRFLLKTYYGLELDSAPVESVPLERRIRVTDQFNDKVKFYFNEKQYLKYLYDEGRCNIKEVNDSSVRHEFALIAGRRGGKSASSAIISAYESYKLLKYNHPQRHFGLQEDDKIFITCVATSTDQAVLLFGSITSYLNICSYFSRFKNDPTSQYMKMRTPHSIERYGPGCEPSIIIRAAPCSARGLRGPGNLVVILDEIAHFVDDSHNKSDSAVYDAITPSVATFGKEGKIIAISSPLSKEGVLYDLYKSAMDGSDSVLAMVLPSWELNPTLDASFLRERWKRNPVSYECEFGGGFSEKIKSWMNRDLLVKSINPGLQKQIRGIYGVPYYMGIDIGAKNDPTSVSICHVESTSDSEGKRKSIIQLDYNEIISATTYSFADTEFLDFDKIVEWVQELCRNFNVVKGLMDQAYGPPVFQSLHKVGITQFEMKYFTDKFNSEIYQNFLLNAINQTVQIYDEKPEFKEGDEKVKKEFGPLVTEILNLQETVRSKYISRIHAPKREGHHDDRSDATVRAIWLATVAMKKGDIGNYKKTTREEFLNLHTANSSLKYHKNKYINHGYSDSKRLPPKRRRR